MDKTEKYHALLDSYKTKKAQESAQKAAEEQNRINNMINRMQDPALQAEITELIDIANYAAKSGISLSQFDAEGIKHRIGFIRKQNNITAIGIINSGACGPIDLHVTGTNYKGITNKETTIDHHAVNRGEITAPRPQDIKKFLDGWSDFKTEIYDYLDKVLAEVTE